MNPICLALDVENAEQAFALLKKVEQNVGYVKIGKQLFVAEGPAFVREVVKRGHNVFLDLKYHDIPNTVAAAGIEAAKLGVAIFNVHATGGVEMMRTTKEQVAAYCTTHQLPIPKIIAVTVLTSISETALHDELLIQQSVDDYVVHLALLAKQAGLDGVVASAREAKSIREACGEGFLIVTPGIRPSWSASNDQKRIVTPIDALRNGANILVIGRPIAAASDPAEAARRIIAEISSR